MGVDIERIVLVVAIGIGATAVMDLWAILAKRCFGMPSLDYAMVGRWLGRLGRQRAHDGIANAPPVRGEAPLGWLAHYIIGILLAGLFLALVGFDWAHRPSLLPALLFGALTVVAPFLILQPALGAGIAASRTPRPGAARLRSLMAHLAFGIGLYAAARIIAQGLGGT